MADAHDGNGDGEAESHVSEEVLAIHEAGHAVACFAMGLLIQDARLYRQGDLYEGWVRPKYFVQYAHQRLRFFSAGFRAERLAAAIEPGWPPHAERDKREYDAVIEAWRNAGHSDADIDAAEKAAAAAVEHLITTKAAAIEAVATVLKDHPAKTASTNHVQRIALVHDALRSAWGGAEPPIIGPPWENSAVPGPLAT